MKKENSKSQLYKVQSNRGGKSVKWQLLSWFKCNRKTKQTSKQKKYKLRLPFYLMNAFILGVILPPRGSFKMFEYTLLWQIEGAIDSLSQQRIMRSKC